MQTQALALHHSNKAYRIAVSALFYLQGLCFATWASRIPTIQQTLGLSEKTLGFVLFSLPVGSIVGLPLAGWLVTKYGSKRVVTNILIIYALLLVLIGLAQNITQLIVVLVGFGTAGNMANIAMNTQAVGVEARYGRNIMASFHGLWSLAGFTASGIGWFMTSHDIIPFHHFITISAIILVVLAFLFNYLLPSEAHHAKNNKIFVMPDKSIFILGVLAFCCMMCEGTMFDWSGIYFKKVVNASGGWIGAGYTAFMATMATGRFVGDWLANKLGFKLTIQLSGLLIATGLGISLLFPTLIPAIAGFLLVGFGVSSVVPLVYSQAGKSKTMAPGVALAAVSSIGFWGFLAGPPLIGVVAGTWGLRISFLLIAVIGLCVALLAKAAKRAGA